MSFSLLGNLPSGNPLQMLSLAGFDAAAHLLPLGRVVPYLTRLVGSSPELEDLQLIPRAHLAVLARRLLLGRHPQALADLALLWQANGSPLEVVRKAADAASQALEGWPTAVGSSRFSPAHADFVDHLGALEQSDPDGPIGRAIRLSRYRGAAGNGPFLPAERGHVGFPVVLSGETAGLGPAVWVTPGPDQGWTPGKGGAAEDLGRTWVGLHEGLPEVEPMYLPEWMAWHVERYGPARLDSAGLAVLLQALAEAEERPLPAGVGFTGQVKLRARGRWEDARIRPVRGLTAKLKAAREAGVFILFACADPEEILRSEPVPGVQLVCLEEGPLSGVLAAINTACAELGLTEYRRRRAVSRMRERLPAAEQRTGIASPLLPDATRGESCPVGVIERPQIHKLRQEWTPGPRPPFPLPGWRCPLRQDDPAGPLVTAAA